MNHELSKYKNLCDWAIRSHPTEDTPTLASMKDARLFELNERLKTNYDRKHMNNWHAGRAGVPKRVREIWVDELLETEVQFDFYELGKELRRLFKV